MLVLLLACRTPDTTAAPETIATPAPEAAPVAPVPYVVTARTDVWVTRDATGAEQPRTVFSVAVRDPMGVERVAEAEIAGVCTATEGAPLAAWTCGGIPVELVASSDAVALIEHAAAGDVERAAIPVTNAAVSWEAPGPTRTVPVRLRYEANGANTKLVVEAFRDAEVVAAGVAEIPGTCAPSASPPAGREDGNVYLTCTDAGVNTLVKLVERDRAAALVRRTLPSKPAADAVFFTLAPPAGFRFDL